MTQATGANLSDLLGIGIYTVSEAAKYARVPTTKLARWILGTSRSRPVVIAQIDPSKNTDRWVTFLDFIQCMAIRDIRIYWPNIHLDKIRSTIDMARQKFNIEYPFAMKHATYRFGDQIILEIPGYGTIEATGPHKSQLNMRRVIEQYLEDLSWDAKGLAAKYTPFSFRGHDIVLDPSIQFGEPTVNPGRYTVSTLCNAYEAEGGYDAAAKAYGVPKEAVEAAMRYNFDYLRTSEAA